MHVARSASFSCHAEPYVASHLARTCCSVSDNLHRRMAACHQPYRERHISWTLTCYTFQKPRAKHVRLTVLFYFRRERAMHAA